MTICTDGTKVIANFEKMTETEQNYMFYQRTKAKIPI
jgi:hypothetical protein